MPEATTYRDTGCEESPSCLACPLARCKYEGPRPRGPQPDPERDAEILLRLGRGESVEDVARAVGVSRRTVFRVKKGGAG